MRLRALHLTNVRKFAGQTASLIGIGDGITVVSEANEFGKSTIFDALHALFFEKFGAAGKAVASLQPRSKGAVRVAAEIETRDGRFVVEKSWLAQKSATVREAGSGRLIASEGAADAWIAALLGDSRDGPTGLLWVRQGQTGLEPAGNSVAEKAERGRLEATRRDLLSSVAGEIDAMTGGRRMDRVMQRCAADLAVLATATGRPTGPWKAALDEVKALAESLEGLERQCRDLSQSLGERDSIERDLARIDAPEMRGRRMADLAAATEAAQEAEAHAVRVAAAEQAVRIAALEEEGAEQALTARLSAEAAVSAAREGLDLAKALAAAAQAEAKEADTEAATAVGAQKAAARVASELRLALDAAHRREAAVRARTDARTLAERLQRAETQRRALEAARARLAANPATAERLAAAEAALSRVVQLREQRDRSSAALRIRYTGEARILTDGAPLAGDVDHPLADLTRLDLPGIGELVLRLGAQAPKVGGDDLAGAEDAMRRALQACGAANIDAARLAAGSRRDAEAAAALAQGLLDAVAPEGLDVLRKAGAEAEALSLADSNAETPADGRPIAEIATAVEAAGISLAEAQDRLDRALRRQSSTGAALAAEAARVDAAARNLAAAEVAAGPEAERDEKRDAAARQLAMAQARARDLGDDMARMVATAPDVLTARANRDRAIAADKAASTRRATLAERRAALSATIETQADRGIEVRRDETADRLEAARRREARMADEVAALTRLKTVLEETRTLARDAYFGPVQAELAPLLGILHTDAEVQFDSDTLLPGALLRGEGEEGLDTLSGGTQEQIAILTRLAFARLFARQGRDVPIILDDALVYSDDDRIVKMFTALNRVAADQQILVFSCRQLAFESLGGVRPAITVTSAV